MANNSTKDVSIDCDESVLEFIDRLQQECVEALGAHCGGGHKEAE